MRYLGNKTRMLEKIDDFIKRNKIDGTIFCDLFSGSASVCDYFKDRYQIIANDILKSSFYFTKAKVTNADVPSFCTFKQIHGVDVFDYFTHKKYPKNDKHFLWKNYSPRGGRQFFTEEVANKIDGIRLELDILLKNKEINEHEYDFLLASLLETTMGLSNTTGTYEAFLKNWDSRAHKTFVLKPLSLAKKPLFSENNVVYNEDSNNLIKKIRGDILYLDTPYTVTDYSSAYHLLETIALYDNPEIRGLTGRRVKKPEKSKYSIENKVADVYEDLIKNANFKHIVISYSTQSLLPIDSLVAILEKYSNFEVIVGEFPFREYKNIRSSQKTPNLKEVLIYMRKNGNN